MRNILFYRFKKNDRGVAAVEFALVAPVLILLVLGIIEFGWLFNGWVTITSAAREGARIATVKDGDDNFKGFVEDAVKNHAYPTFSKENVNASFVIDHEKISGTDYDSVKVTATGDLEPLVGFFVSDTVTLTGEAKMRLY